MAHPLIHRVLDAAGLDRDNRRFVKWEGGDHPKLLDDADLDEMLSSGCFFGRKFADGAPVLDRIDQRLAS